MLIDGKVSITPSHWVEGSFEEFEGYLKGKVLSTKIKPAWEELQKGRKEVSKKEPVKKEKPNKK